MRNIWQSLAWKEWHEHKWRLAALTAILCGLTLYALTDSSSNRDVFGGVFAMTLMVIGPLAIFVGAGTAANERSRGTLAFLQSLPVPLWRVALHKLAFGLLTLVVPTICLMVVIAVWTQALDALEIPYHPPLNYYSSSRENPWSTGHWISDWAAVFVSLSMSFYLWTIAAGARRNDEISAGAFALLAMVGWWIVLLLVGSFIYGLLGNPGVLPPVWRWVTLSGCATAPGGFLPSFDRGGGMYPWAAIPIAVVVHVGLALWYVRRFNGAVNLEARSPIAAVREGKRFDWLRPPFASAWSAIAWKQFREAAPVAIAGLVGILAIFAVLWTNLWLEWRLRATEIGRNQNHMGELVKYYVMMYAGVSVSIGMFIAAVAGIGVALNDTSPKLSNFWRSRPMNPDLWYWAKFGTGLLVLLTTLYLPVLVLAAMFHPDGLLGLCESEHLIFPALQIALFASSLALTCLLRQAVYAAVLSIGVIYLGVLPTWFIWGTDPPYQAVAVSLVMTAGVMTVVGWLAMRNDWGWRR
ncbi:MAG: hypothetical protein KF708_06380 [Pirellulales bacterium]|nr:hypothetical protein [Pirellulales bacterium]